MSCLLGNVHLSLDTSTTPRDRTRSKFFGGVPELDINSIQLRRRVEAAPKDEKI